MKNTLEVLPSLHITKFLKISLLLLFLLHISSPVNAIQVIKADQTDTPQGLVLLIVEGLGSSYIYPEKIPYALDGAMLEKAVVNNISLISDHSLRAINVEAPEIETDTVHSIIITGSPRAKPPMIDYESSTVYDVAHDHGLLVIGVLEGADFEQMLSRQDIAVYDSTGSINEPEMIVITNDHGSTAPVLTDVLELFNKRAASAPEEIKGKPAGSIDRYHAYNYWALKTGTDIIEMMKSTDQRYILTIDIAAVETAGRYRANSGYVEAIEGLDRMLPQLYDSCQENNMALIITSGYGMAFPDADSRGGSKSEKYADRPEVRQVPLIISSPNIKSSTLENANHYDLAPGLLSVLDLPDELHFSSGVNPVIKDYANIKVNLPGIMDIKLTNKTGTVISSQGYDEYLFTGLQKNVDYTIQASSSEEGTLTEMIYLDSDTVIYLQAYEPGNITSVPGEGQSSDTGHKTLGSVIIVVINLFGITLIIRILRD